MVETARKLWNAALAQRKRRWDEEGLTTSYRQQSLTLTAEKRVDPVLRQLYSQAAQDVLLRLDRAFKAFFANRANYPRFKKFSEFGSFTYPQAYNGSVKPDRIHRRLFLSRVGNVKVVYHRELPQNQKLKICTVVREGNGEWYACLVYEGGEKPSLLKKFVSPIGIDLGVKSLVVTTEGLKIAHPHFLRKSEIRMKLAYRRFSKARRGSRNREKARKLLAIRSSKIARQRADFNHKLSFRLVQNHDFIAFEALKIRNMLGNHSLSKSISDAGWGQLRNFSEYKAERAGKRVVRVPPEYSTQECYFCGTNNQVPLGVETFQCAGCSRTLDRDSNGAWNVLKRGLIQVGQDMPELKPAETGPLPDPETGRASSVVEAGTKRGEDIANRRESAAGSPRPRGRMSQSLVLLGPVRVGAEHLRGDARLAGLHYLLEVRHHDGPGLDALVQRLARVEELPDDSELATLADVPDVGARVPFGDPR